MYKILVYSGGVYRFDEVLECVEDIGGIVLKKDEFNISRGSYFISQEVHVFIVTPDEGLDELKQIATDLKGDIEEINIDDEIRISVVSILPVYNLLCKAKNWVDINYLADAIECPCINGICKEFNDISCHENLEKTLDDMCRMEIAEKRTLSNVIEYRIKEE
ncbi:methyl-coenzyme M reductase family protein [Methanobacterium sp. SMA-27]|uniref:methyl-coenzyme M reductase family protein n=1 Tax=Methanobacterium sp. SMA-27 TaxID=1495336 RepID=UPI00064F26CD|nr:methyl-coenzyme M reductase family protein [Methanobacterium sp. SMA-27]